MTTMKWLLVMSLTVSVHGQDQAKKLDNKTLLEASIQQLRDAQGKWFVTTDFLNSDGTVARSVAGTYTFEWVIEDRVLSGVADTPALNMKSGILFYINESKAIMEMVSVGQDGNLWIMTGPLGEEVRYTQTFKTHDGKDSQLRFTRFNVTENGFESKMDVTDDDGKTWKPGNHQRFTRAEH